MLKKHERLEMHIYHISFTGLPYKCNCPHYQSCNMISSKWQFTVYGITFSSTISTCLCPHIVGCCPLRHINKTYYCLHYRQLSMNDSASPSVPNIHQITYYSLVYRCVCPHDSQCCDVRYQAYGLFPAEVILCHCPHFLECSMRDPGQRDILFPLVITQIKVDTSKNDSGDLVQSRLENKKAKRKQKGKPKPTAIPSSQIYSNIYENWIGQNLNELILQEHKAKYHYEHPSWDHMPNDRRILLVNLSRESSEYKTVREMVSSYISYCTYKIVRIQNRNWWKDFVDRSKHLNRTLPAASHPFLFHVASQATAKRITDCMNHHEICNENSELKFFYAANTADKYKNSDLGNKRAVFVTRVIFDKSEKKTINTHKFSTYFVPKYDSVEFYPEYVAYYQTLRLKAYASLILLKPVKSNLFEMCSFMFKYLPDIDEQENVNEIGIYNQKKIREDDQDDDDDELDCLVSSRKESKGYSHAIKLSKKICSPMNLLCAEELYRDKAMGDRVRHKLCNRKVYTMNGTLLDETSLAYI